MRKGIITLAFALTSALSFAQQDEQMSLYMYNQLYYNPAYAGSRDAVSAIAIARFQWVNFEGAPRSQWFSVHAPLMQRYLGVGLNAVNDRIGNRTRTAVYADVSGSIPVNKNGSRIAVGLSGGFDVIGYDFSEVKVNDPSDPYFGKVYTDTKPNVGAGLYYYGEKHYIGISSPRLLEVNSNNFDTLVTRLNSRHFFLSGGYVFTLNSVLKLKPSTLIKYTPHAPITIDVNATFLMYDCVWAGLMYRFHESMGVNILVDFKKTFGVGYVYDFPINGLRTFQSGSHEIFLRYDMRPKKSAYSSPRYF